MATINLRFRASSVADQEGTLYYSIVHQRMVRSFASCYRVFPDEWSDTMGCVVTGGRKDREWEVRLVQAMTSWELRHMRHVAAEMEAAGGCTIDTMAEALRSLPPCQSVFAFVERQIAVKRSMGRIGTHNNYVSAYLRFREFRDGHDLAFGHFTADMMARYEAWLVARRLRQNSIAFYLRTLRTLYRKAVAEGLAEDSDIFEGVRTSGVRTAKRAVGIDIMRRIERLELKDDSAMAMARDMFMLSFYLRGMAFVDMAFLRKTDLRCGMLSYCRRKTNQAMTIEWERPMQSIVERHAHRTCHSPYLLPILSGREANPYARYRQVEQTVNANLKRIGLMVGLRMPLTTYVARHSWACVALHLDIPVATISEGMGHSSLRTTQIYLDSIDEATVSVANRKIMGLVTGNL